MVRNKSKINKNMRKYLFLSLLMMLAHVQAAKAEATDVSTMDNLIYPMPLTAAQGDQSVDLCFAMKNSVEIRGFQFKVFLPEGVTAAKTSTGKFQYTLSADRLPEGHDQQAVFSEHESDEGAYILVTCSSQYDESFSVGDGLVMTFKVNIAADMELGDYPVIIREMKLSETDISKYYVTDYVEGTLTVEENDGRIKFNEASATLPSYTAGEKGDVTMTRTINKDSWSTIVLPFNLTKANATAIFGSDAKFARFSGFEVDYGDDEENLTPLGINILFDTYTIPNRGKLEGGTPVLVKTTKDIKEPFQVDQVTLTDDIKDETKSDEYGTTGKFTASLVKTVVPEDGLFIAGNKFYYSTGKTQLKAFRGWFELDAVLGKDTDFGAKIGFYIDGEPTSIEGISVRAPMQKGAVYTVGGQYVGKDVDERQLPKGVYICDGKKYVVE